MAGKPYWAWFWEQGTGKTKLAIDNAAWLYMKGLIDGVLWLAPNGPHANFTLEELPKHMPSLHLSLTWRSGKMERSVNKVMKPKEQLPQLLKFDGLAVLSMNTEALLTKLGARYVRAFLAQRKVIFIVDESSCIASPSTKITMRVQSLSRQAPYRRIMNGTPASEGPLQYYSQCRFLSPAILGFSTYADYKLYAAEWEEREFGSYIDKDGEKKPRIVSVVATNPDGSKKWKNLEEIHAKVFKFASRLLKKDMFDLPPKLYAKRLYSLSAEQRAVYKELLYNYIAQFDNGAFIDGLNPAVRTLRLQQVCCGYSGVENSDEPTMIIPGAAPRITDALGGLIDQNGDQPTIIWARFHHDITQVLNFLRENGKTCSRYDGAIGAEEKERNRLAYVNDEVQYICANQHSMGKSWTFTNTRHEIYYSNYFDLESRLHSEDRGHRYGQKHNLLITDIMAEGTVDFKVVNALRNKHSVQDILVGDPRKDWI